ncbi:MAG: type I DNA topoisomerase [Deltaproteobacteria bacterium]|nr:type I DNA topoisomerase [Deltaproteobacteria bacterium]
MPKSLLIVESPTKAKTLQKYLGGDIQVVSSKGHIKDLPKNELGVDLERDFAPKYVTILGKAKVIQDLKKAAAGIPEIYLGPDPDREGEAIAWHIAEVLGEKNHRFHRVLLLELTPKAIKEALAKPVKLNRPRCDSQQARRILDRLVGYQISPLLWQKVKTGLSAGRVQSVALRLVCDRERAIMAFVPEEYWTLDACLDAGAPPPFAAYLYKHKNKNVKPDSAVKVEKILDALEAAEFRVATIDTKPQRRHPAPPFITSSLQMEANRKLRFPPKRTMSLAQRLYEGKELGDEGPVGLITYMRSDSTRVSAEALDAVRTFIDQTYGGEHLPAAPNRFKSPKGAQEAHEAIRPTGVTRRPQDVKAYLSKDELALYELIWRRFVASQMTPAVFDLTTVDIAASDYLFRATASVLKFAGFTKVYQESRETEEAAGPEKFPPLAAGDVLQLRDFDPQQHFTKPPARFTEASLIKEMEVQGIGRPSTYATILTNLQDRLYVVKEKTALKPTEMGLVVSDLLVENFSDIMDPKFTAGLEDNLDRVAAGKIPWQELMRDFYGAFAQELNAARVGMRDVKTLPNGPTCPECGAKLAVRWGKNGEKFLGCAAYPKCRFSGDFSRNARGDIILPVPEPTSPGAPGEPPAQPFPVRGKPVVTGLPCPKCGKELLLRRGRLGEFLGCSGYPKCRFTQNFTRDAQGQVAPQDPEADAAYSCPREGCGGRLAKRRSRRGIFYGCSNYPKCDFTMNQPPQDKPCPRCQYPWLMKKGKKILCPRDECSFEETAAAVE